MDRSSIRLMEDIVLEAREERKSNSSKSRFQFKEKRKSKDTCCLKVNAQTLNVSEDSEKQLFHALNDVRGNALKLADLCEYKKNSNLGKQYWLERCQLVVKEVSNYLSLIDTDSKDVEEIEKDFSGFQIEKTYNFHASHCSEALVLANGDMGKALELLFYKYYGIQDLPKKEIIDTDFNKAFERKIKEKEDLQSHYGDYFKEDITNRSWIFNVKLDYLIKNDETQKTNCKPEPVSKDVCELYLEENRVSENECQLVHEHLGTENKSDIINDSFFTLEVKFPEDCKYPYEPPYFYFYKSDRTYPALNCLRIARRLHNEALRLCDKGNTFIRSIIDLLKNEQEILSYLTENNETFLNHDNPLFSEICNNKDVPNKIETLKQNMEIKAMYTGVQTNFEYSEIDTEKFRLRVKYKYSEIIKLINENQVTILFGEIGCGKTTQVPQYILDDWLKNESEESNAKFGIIVTQPRKTSAIGVAERVAAEQHECVGNLVGYQVELKSALSSCTRLTFCTERILLERLSSDLRLDSVTHVIVDQVHERSAECDFLLMCLKKLIGIRKDLKVVLMSSSPKIDIFSDYFGKAPVLNVAPDGYYHFDSTEFFLEDIMDRMYYNIDESSEYTRKNRGDWNQINDDISNADDLKKIKGLHVKDTILDEDLTLPQVIGRYSKYSQITRRNIYVMDHDKINYDLIEKTVEWSIDYKSYYNKPTCGALLIFLPGIEEITTMKNILEKNEKLADPKKYVIIPLHSDLSPEEQKSVFKKQKSKVLRIILTTDIAESSVGMDDMYMKIIDTGKIKERRFNSSLHRDSFDTCWISKANYHRRIARASHTYANYYIHLYSSSRFKHHLADKATSEISRIALEPLLLRLKILQKDKDLDFFQALGNMLEPPPTDNIKAAIKRLQYVGALDPGSMLTPLGYHLASLPVDVRIGKLILFGAVFRCVDSALTIAACLLHESPFVDSTQNKQEIKAKKREYATGNSDQLTSLRIYKKWQEISARDYDAGKIFASKNFLSLDTLKVLADTKHYWLELLNSIGFVSVNVKTRSMGQDLVLESTGHELNVNNENYKFLQGLICASLYPSLARLIPPESSGTVSEVSNPSEEFRFLTKENETVYVHSSSINFNTDQHNCPSQLLVYQQKIKKSKIFIREVSEAPMLPIVLFCGYGIDIEVNDGDCTALSLGDGLISCSVGSLKVAQLLQLARMELAKLLEQKVRDPQLDLVNHPAGRKVVNAIVDIVTNG